jgi:FkbM family methyltransferase
MPSIERRDIRKLLRVRTLPLATRLDGLALYITHKLREQPRRIRLAGGRRVYLDPRTLEADWQTWCQMFVSSYGAHAGNGVSARGIYASDYRGSVVVDIGAHKGYYAAFAFLAGANRVISYEPESRNFALLERAAGSFPESDRWARHKAAVGATSGRAALRVDQESWAHSLARPPDVLTIEGSEQVGVVAMASVLREAAHLGGRRLVVKLDAEGSECEIVLGTSQELWSLVDELFLEHHDFAPCALADLLDHLRQAGLTVREERHEIVRLRRKDSRTWLAPAPAPHAPVPTGARPTFSVVVAAYQAASTIAEAIESALAQTVPPHEIIVCDDGSTDGTEGVLAPYSGRLVLVRQENRGGPAAMNTAVAHATGDFVVVLDADDAYLPARLEALAELGMARPDLDVLTTNAYFERDGAIVGRFYETRPFPVDDQRRAMLEWCFLFAPAVRRSRLLDVGGFDESLPIGYDWDCWLRLILAGARAGLVDEPLIRYRFVPGSLSDRRTAALRARVTVLQKAASAQRLTPAERRFLADRITEAEARARLAEAREALRSGAEDARKRALAVVTTRRVTGASRLKAALAVASPGLARLALGLGADEKDRFPAPAARVPRS